MNDNAIVRDELMNEMKFIRERFSCSAHYYEALQSANEEAEAIDQPLLQRNIRFGPGSHAPENIDPRNNEEADLTEARHQAKQIAYAVSPERADEALAAKCDWMQAPGIEVFVCGAADWR
jgi:hypothetical protein